jgi:hypothetical protein
MIDEAVQVPRGKTCEDVREVLVRLGCEGDRHEARVPAGRRTAAVAYWLALRPRQATLSQIIRQPIRSWCRFRRGGTPYYARHGDA